MEYKCGTTSKMKDVVKHHFIHPSGHPSVPSWSVYSDGVEITDATQWANVPSNTHTPMH